MNYLFDELDKILALIGVIFSLALTIWLKITIVNNLFVTIGILCLIACTTYLTIRRILHPSLINSLEKIRCSNRFYIILNILFLILLSCTIIIMYLRPEPYIRPLGYFISITLMVVIVANEILFVSTQKSYVCFALCKIIIIGLILVYSQIMIFPSVLGTDPWWHQWFTLRILNNGYIPEGFAYSKLPVMHLIIGMTSLVTDLEYNMASMFSISSIQVICNVLFVFLLGKFLISTKVGLLAALLLETSNYHIRFSYWAIPNTIAATFILPIIFILFKIRKIKPFIGTLIIMLLMGTLILTHTITSMCLAILLFILWLSYESYVKLIRPENISPITWTTLIFFSTLMLAFWTYISGHINYLSRFLLFLQFKSNELSIVLSYLHNIPFLEQLFIYLGLFLYFSLSFIGCFYMMSKNFRSSNRVIMTVGGIAILCISFFSLIIDKQIIFGRWFYFSQILLAIPLSLSIFLLIGIIRYNIIKCLSISILIFALSFLLIINPVANIDNNLFYPNSGIRYALTDSELCALGTISEIYNASIGVDWYSRLYYEFQVNREFVRIDESVYTGDFSDLKNVLFLVREVTLNQQYPTRWGLIRIEYDIYSVLEEQDFSRIYNCGSTSGYLKP